MNKRGIKILKFISNCFIKGRENRCWGGLERVGGCSWIKEVLKHSSSFEFGGGGGGQGGTNIFLLYEFLP